MKFLQFNMGNGIITIPKPESYKDCFALIKSDQFRISGKKESFSKIIIKKLMPFSKPVLFWFRLCQHRGAFFPLCRYIYKKVSRKYQIDLPIRTKVGYGLYLGHGMCMVINGGTIIGNNVNLSQFLNIGTNKGTPAIIGDNVYIGPHVSIIEDVIIGNNATIGAGSVVTKNIGENSTAVGVPAKVIHNSIPAQYIKNRFSNQND